MKRFISSVFVLLAAFTLAGSNAFAVSGVYTTGTSGYDISYPNCTINPITGASFGIVGVNNGLNFSKNPCLTSESSWFIGHLSLYSNTGYPGSTSTNAQLYKTSPKLCADTDLNCIAYDYGYNAGLYSFNYAKSNLLTPSMWWLDVETGNSWTSDTLQNQNAIQGQYDALIANGISQVGVYSTTAQWGTITSAWQNNWANWGATIVKTASKASTFCTGHQFTGGPTYLIQYKSTVDKDYAC